MEFLLQKGIGSVEDVDGDGDFPVMLAAMSGSVEAMEFLLSKTASLVRRSSAGHTVLIRASMNGKLALVKWLLEVAPSYVKEGQTLKISDVDNDGFTATMCAALHGQFDVLKYLVTVHKASLTERSRPGQTALLWAARNGQLESVKYLIENGADFNVKDHSGNSILDCAYCSKNLELVSYLDKVMAPSTTVRIRKIAVVITDGSPYGSSA